MTRHRWWCVQPWGHICSAIALLRVICSAAHSRQYLITSQIGWISSEGQQLHSLSSSSMRFCSFGSSRRNFYFLEPWHSSCLPPGSKPSFPGFIQSGRHRVAMIPVARGINIASFHTDPLDITCVWPTFFKSSLVKAAASAAGMSVCQDCLFHVFSLGDCI